MLSSSSSSSSSSRTWVFSAKVIFTSIGIVSIALLLKHSVPLVFQFLLTQLPILWTRVLSWLRPPYLYILINAIIVSIAASSKFNQTREGSPEMKTDSGVMVMEKNAPVFEEREGRKDLDEKSGVVIGNEEEEEEEEKEEKEEEEEEYVISRSNLMASESEKKMGSPEKPLVSSRFIHRRTVRSSPEVQLPGGRTLGVNRPRRHETFETTWKAITEGRPMPLTRHLKKSEACENHNPQGENSPNPPHRTMRKSETLKDRTNQTLLSPSTPSPMKMRKEPSLGQDELNRRVEAFINKFNEQMRLQRQESLRQYREMMNRGT